MEQSTLGSVTGMLATFQYNEETSQNNLVKLVITENLMLAFIKSDGLKSLLKPSAHRNIGWSLLIRGFKKLKHDSIIFCI